MGFRVGRGGRVRDKERRREAAVVPFGGPSGDTGPANPHPMGAIPPHTSKRAIAVSLEA